MCVETSFLVRRWLISQHNQFAPRHGLLSPGLDPDLLQHLCNHLWRWVSEAQLQAQLQALAASGPSEACGSNGMGSEEAGHRHWAARQLWHHTPHGHVGDASNVLDIMAAVASTQPCCAALFGLPGSVLHGTLMQQLDPIVDLALPRVQSQQVQSTASQVNTQCSALGILAQVWALCLWFMSWQKLLHALELAELGCVSTLLKSIHFCNQASLCAHRAVRQFDIV